MLLITVTKNEMRSFYKRTNRSQAVFILSNDGMNII